MRLTYLAFMAAGLVSAAYMIEQTLAFWLLSFGLAGVLAALALIDFRSLRLPNRLTYPLIAAGLLQAITLPYLAIPTSILGAALGYGFFWLVASIYLRVRGYEGLGLGDAKLLAAGGAWTGATGLAPIVLIGSGSALLVILIGRPSRLEPSGALAFGPWLALGIWFVWLFGIGGGLLP